MRFFYKLPLRLRSVFRRRRVEQELSDELRFHLEELIEEKVAKGMSSEQARYAALRELGGVEQIKEECRDMRRVSYIENFVQDVRFGLRQLRRSPGFTAVAVITLALGIGANTAIFSLIDAVLLKMLPVKSPEQLVQLTTISPDGKTNDAFSYTAFRQLQDQNQKFSGMLAYRELGNLDLDADGQPGIAKGQVVSGSYFSMLGVRAMLGGVLVPEDDRVGGAPVAVIGYSYWASRFNGNRSIVGKKINLNGSAFTIIGVTPPEFFGLQPGESVDVSVPLSMISAIRPEFAAVGTPYSTLTAPFRNWLHLMARLRPGVTDAGALANLDPIFAQAKRSAAEGLAGLPFDSPRVREMFLESRLRLEPGSRGMTTLRKRFSKPLLVLMVIVGLLLLIACANVANLLLARANSRHREVALRMALGAGRVRLLRQLLTESALLAMGGGALGLLFAFGGTRFLIRFMSHSSSPVLLTVAPDVGILAFTMAVSLLAAMIFGLVPGWRASRFELSRTLRETAMNFSGGPQHSRMRKLLALMQVALSLVVLVGAGLLLRSLRKLQDFNPGFDRENVLLFSLNPAMVGYKTPQVIELYERLLGRIRTLPGVRAASFSMHSPLSPHFDTTLPVVEGYAPRAGENAPININIVGPGYFKTLGTTMVLGREFTDADRAGAPKVAVINQAMARYFFGDQIPLGRRFSIPGYVGDSSIIEIVGMVENTKYHNLREPAPPAAYLPFLQSPDAEAMTFEVRTGSNPYSFIASARHLVHEADTRLPVFDVKTLDVQVTESLLQERLVASLATLFGVLALTLTCVGLYGLVAYSVARRRHEIGVRMALGAGQREVLRLVLGEGFRMTLLGVALGLAGALALTRFVSSLLFAIKPTDPLTFVVVPVILVAITLLASYIPARRATKVDPMVALRHE